MLPNSLGYQEFQTSPNSKRIISFGSDFNFFLGFLKREIADNDFDIRYRLKTLLSNVFWAADSLKNRNHSGNKEIILIKFLES